MRELDLSYFNLIWLVAGIVIAVRLVSLAFRVLNRLVDRIIPPLSPCGEPGGARKENK